MLGAGEAAGTWTSESRSALKSGLLMTNVPSRSSVRASHIPSPAGPPTISLCTALSSAEVVKLIINCGFAKAWAGKLCPAQRTARKDASVFSSDCTFTVSIATLPLTHCH